MLVQRLLHFGPLVNRAGVLPGTWREGEPCDELAREGERGERSGSRQRESALYSPCMLEPPTKVCVFAVRGCAGRKASDCVGTRTLQQWGVFLENEAMFFLYYIFTRSALRPLPFGNLAAYVSGSCDITMER